MTVCNENNDGKHDANDDSIKGGHAGPPLRDEHIVFHSVGLDLRVHLHRIPNENDGMRNWRRCYHGGLKQ